MSRRARTRESATEAKHYRPMPDEAEPTRCVYCDDTGDVHSLDGEWRGRCNCPAGAGAATDYELLDAAQDQHNNRKTAS